ncbi:hypothetical protein BN903_128 [Halorubrum sp. AJ67]|nr:hypothetical protein BN903_128 [Halorubrum sp. AJ67]
MAESRRDRRRDVLVRVAPSLRREDSDRLAVCLPRAATDRLHDAAETAADDGVTAFRESFPEFLRDRRGLGADRTPADDADAHERAHAPAAGKPSESGVRRPQNTSSSFSPVLDVENPTETLIPSRRERKL